MTKFPRDDTLGRELKQPQDQEGLDSPEALSDYFERREWSEIFITTVAHEEDDSGLC
jgi:hypothetical protein